MSFFIGATRSSDRANAHSSYGLTSDRDIPKKAPPEEMLCLSDKEVVVKTPIPYATELTADFTKLKKLSGSKDAPPTRPPSMSARAKSSSAFAGFIEPPYWIRT